VRSLRGRLTLGVTLVLAIVLLVAGTVVSHRVDRTERTTVDDRLKRTAELSTGSALAIVDQELPDDDKRLDAVLTASGSTLRLIFGRQTLLETGARPEARAPARLGFQTFTANGRHFRAFTMRLRDKNLGGSAVLQVTTALRAVERRGRRLDRFLLLVGAAVLLVAGIGTWFAADLVLRPLRRLRAVASSIAGDEDLGRRVPSDDGPAETRSLAASFNAMLARLGRSAADRERALAATRRFAADAGHELRTPLTSVQATLSALSRHPDVPAERRTAMLGDALAEQRRLVALLDGLQALARGDAEAVERAPVDLGEVVDAAATAARARHPGLAIAARLPAGETPVSGWEPGLRLIADNLIENAARHGRPGGRVEVALGDGPVLTVDDDGPGIPPERREAVFEPFVRLADGDGDGSGLGLALVAQQARQHGATVAIEDSPLGGARFVVRFAR
jgi:two-component system, OmpR family, sensor histidine kinase PrrB